MQLSTNTASLKKKDSKNPYLLGSARLLSQIVPLEHTKAPIRRALPSTFANEKTLHLSTFAKEKMQKSCFLPTNPV